MRDATLTDVALSKAQIYPVLLANIDWPSGAVRVWTGYGNLSWNSLTWAGTGDLGTMSTIQESSDGRANGVTLTLNGIKLVTLVDALAVDVQGRSTKVYFGLMTSTGTWEVEPYCIFDGFIDFPKIEDSGDTSKICIQLEKEFIDARAQCRRSTDQDQKIDYPTDRGFEYVAGLASKQVLWGRTSVGTTTSAGGSAGLDGSLNETES